MLDRIIAFFLLTATASGACSAQIKCASLGQPKPLAEPAACLRLISPISHAQTRKFDPQAFIDIAENRQREGRFADATTALDCAESTIVRDESSNSSTDDMLRYQVVRRRGAIAYHQEDIAEALSHFECALDMAKQRNDRPAVAKDLNTVGSALRRLGDFRGALAALNASIEIRRKEGDKNTGVVLNNIADVYRELKEPDTALRYYREALQMFRNQGNTIESAHVMESMAAIALERGDAAQAEPWLLESLNIYRLAMNHTYRARIYAGLTRAALMRGNLPQAQRWSAAGFADASENGATVPAVLQLQGARVDRLRGQPSMASARLNEALSQLSPNDIDKSALLDELSLSQEATGNYSEAAATARKARDAERALSQAQQDRQLGWLRARFDMAERNRRITTLENENRQRAMTLWLVVACTVALALLVSMLMLRNRQRLRLAEETRRARHEQEIERYRREVQALAVDREIIRILLDHREDGVCVVDGRGIVLAANAVFTDRLGLHSTELSGKSFFDQLEPNDKEVFAALLDDIETHSSRASSLELGASRLRITACPVAWAQGDGLALLSFDLDQTITTTETQSGKQSDIALASTQPDSKRLISEQLNGIDKPDSLPSEASHQLRESFRRAVVELMLLSVETWERSTGESRLELAEKSRIWRVAIDEGRVRARAMDRYLSLTKLPNHPRWRDVVRSAYFVLANCEINETEREQLQRRVDDVLAHTRRSALA
jgi:two-component system, sensor histidine kinase ChiS